MNEIFEYGLQQARESIYEKRLEREREAMQELQQVETEGSEVA